MTDTEKSTPAPPARSFKERLFLPVVVIAVALGITIVTNQRQAPPPQRFAGNNALANTANFELMVSELQLDSQRIELLEEQFDFWSKRTIGRQLITLKPDSWQDRVLSVPGLAVMLENVEWNKSSATLMLHCRPSVEFEVPFDNPEDWRIRIIDDVAYVEAPDVEIDEPNIPTDSVEHYVIEEEFFINGEREAQKLRRILSEEIRNHVNEPAFMTPQRREACRRNLETFLRNLFRATDKTNHVRHVYVSFPDEPPPIPPGESTLSPTN